jgi:hypothetical protein
LLALLGEDENALTMVAETGVFPSIATLRGCRAAGRSVSKGLQIVEKQGAGGVYPERAERYSICRGPSLAAAEVLAIMQVQPKEGENVYENQTYDCFLPWHLG